MRDSNKTYVYILGAGASKPDGMPLTNEIIDTAFGNFGGPVDNRVNTNLIGPWEKDEALKKYRPVFELIDHWYGTELTPALDNLYKTTRHPFSLGLTTNIVEDFFTRLYYIKNGIKTYNLNWNKIKIMEVSKKAEWLFFRTLCYEAIDRRPYKTYEKFVERMLKRSGKHCIISFNYDLLLEDVLLTPDRYLKYDGQRWNYPEELRWTYCLDFSSIENHVPYSFPTDDEAKILFLKLHGSFNWGFCPVNKDVTCYSLHADAHIYPRFYNGKDYRCCNGSHASLPLLIPPVKVKEINIPALRNLWDKAAEIISSCNELHVIGYSLPEVDKEAKNLIQKIKPSNLDRIVIANSNETHISRFTQIFGNSIETYKNFEEYLSKSEWA